MAGTILGSMNLATAKEQSGTPAAMSAGAFDVTTSKGLTLTQVIKAFLDPAARDKLGTKNIMLFTKSGGFVEDGNKQRNLKVDLPVRVLEQGGDVSFQYFVEIKDDLTPKIAHCSDVRLHVFLDGEKVLTTQWMGYDGRSPALPLQTNKITLHDVEKGGHDLVLVPEGRISGCNNEGFLFSWGGIAVIY